MFGFLSILFGIYFVSMHGQQWYYIPLSLPIYVALGFAPVHFLMASNEADSEFWFWLLTGGAAYILGVLAFVRSIRYPLWHVAWHIFVLTGSVTHYIGCQGLVQKRFKDPSTIA